MRHLLGTSFWVVLSLSLGFVFCMNLAMYDQIPTDEAHHDLASYGPYVSQSTITGFKREADRLEPVVSKDLMALGPQAVQLGVKNYQSARDLVDSVESSRWTNPSVLNTDRGKLTGRINALPSYRRLAHCHDVMDAYRGCNREALTARAEKQLRKGGSNGIELPESVTKRLDILSGQCRAGMGLAAPELLDYTQSNFRLSVYMVPLLAALVVVAPRLVKDQVHGVRQTQLTTRTGRILPGLQVFAMVCAGLLMMLMVAAGSFLMWVPKIAGLQDLPVFDGHALPWFTWSLGEYLAVFVLLCLGSAFLVFLLVLWISMHCRTYTRLVLLAVPVVLLAVHVFVAWLLVDPCCIGSVVTRIVPLPGIELYLILGLLVLTLCLCWWSARKLCCLGDLNERKINE